MARRQTRPRIAERLFAALTCVALTLWTVMPNATHIPKIVENLQEHGEMITEHGHSHGLEEDLLWAMHGHSHDVADHDHSHAILAQARPVAVPVETGTAWRGRALADWSPPLFRLERPPRA